MIVLYHLDIDESLNASLDVIIPSSYIKYECLSYVWASINILLLIVWWLIYLSFFIHFSYIETEENHILNWVAYKKISFWFELLIKLLVFMF